MPRMHERSVLFDHAIHWPPVGACAEMHQGSGILPEKQNDGRKKTAPDDSNQENDPQKTLLSIHEALACMIKETRSKYEVEQKVISELITIKREIDEFRSSFDSKKTALASKLEELIQNLTDSES
uniref:Expressed protein n=1 Tax=Echinococcus granulosus TaxID=6210 RepID=A0A068WCU0_ECHGR|nr:expressed protein [Echinococcus granulosus]